MKKIEEKLYSHKENIARLQINILNLDDLDREIIEEMCLPACVVTEIPRSITNKFSSKTENAVLLKSNLKKEAVDKIMSKPHCYGKMDWILKYQEDEVPRTSICDCKYKNSCMRLTRNTDEAEIKESEGKE